jgi:hypothetical protein
MNTLITLLLVVGTISALALIAWTRHNTARAQVLDALERIQATRAVLRPDWLDLDRGTMTYDVEYSTPDGRRHSNRCKVAIQVGSDHAVYWERSLQGTA